MTALSGGRRSLESFAISIAVLAAPYAAIQTDSLDDSGSSSAGSARWEDGEAMESAMPLDEAASALWSLVLGRKVASSCFMYSIVDVGGGLFGRVDDDEGLFRKYCMMNVGTTKRRRPHEAKFHTHTGEFSRVQEFNKRKVEQRETTDNDSQVSWTRA